MTFLDRELSTYGSTPIELHKFQRGSTIQIWTYTTGIDEVVYNGSAYIPIPINRNKIDVSQDTIKNALTITIPSSSDFALAFSKRGPTDIFNYWLYRFHDGDSETISLWTGRVINISFKEEKATVLCESVITSLKRYLLKRKYQLGCPLTLYGNICGANAADFYLDTVTSIVDGYTIQADNVGANGDGYYSGGYAQSTIGGITERTYITSQVGNILTIGNPLEGLGAGLPIRVYPGCDHTTTQCSGKFNNVLNYGGCPWIPTKNPMSGTPIF